MRRPSGTCPAPSSQRRAAGDSISARQGSLGTEEKGKARGRELGWGEGGDRGTFEWGPPPPSLGCGSLGGACLPPPTAWAHSPQALSPRPQFWAHWPGRGPGQARHLWPFTCSPSDTSGKGARLGQGRVATPQHTLVSRNCFPDDASHQEEPDSPAKCTSKSP